MSYESKTWKDRYVENPGRRTLSIVSQSASAMVVDVTRNEGEVDQIGDAFSATNMNDLEGRISDGFSDVASALTTMNANFQAGCSTIAGAITAEGVPTAGNASPDTMATNIATLADLKYQEGQQHATASVVQVGTLSQGPFDIKTLLPDVYGQLTTDNFYLKLDTLTGYGRAKATWGSAAHEYSTTQGCVSMGQNTFSCTFTYSSSTGQLKITKRTSEYQQANSYDSLNLTVRGEVNGTVYCIY